MRDEGLTEEQAELASTVISTVSYNANRLQFFDRFSRGTHRTELNSDFSSPVVADTLKRFTNEQLIYQDETDEQYYLSELGKMMEEPLSELIDVAIEVHRLMPIVECVPPSQRDFLDLEKLSGVEEPTVGDDVTPSSGSGKYLRRIAEAERVWEIAPKIAIPGGQGQPNFGGFHNAIMDEDRDIEVTFIHTPQMVDTIQNTPALREEARMHLETGRVEYYSSKVSFPVTLTIFDNEIVSMLGTNNEGNEVYIEARTEDAINWGREIFERIKEKSEGIDYSEIDGP
jgi:predicted transcriptional regulator